MNVLRRSVSRRWHLVAFVFVGGVLAITATALCIAGFTGHVLKDRQRAEWTDNADDGILLEQDRYFDTLNTFGDFRPHCLVVLECEDFFQPSRWLALEKAVGQLQELEGVYNILWIGALPEFDRSGRGLLTSASIPQSLRGMVESAVASTRDLPDAESSRQEWAVFGERVDRHPLVRGQLLSDDGRTMLLQVNSTFPDGPFLERLRAKARQLLQSAGIRVRLTGSAPLFQAHERAFDESHYRVLGLALCVAAGLAIAIFRDIRSLILVGAGPILGGAWAMGIIAWLGEPRNELTDMILPVMLVMVGFTDTVHLVIGIRHEKWRGERPLTATIAAVRKVGPACALTSVTTAIGFASLMMSDSAVVSSFGRASAIAVMIMLIGVVFVTPVIAVAIRGPGISQRARTRLADPPGIVSAPTIWRRILRLPGRYPRAITLVGIAMTVACGASASRLRPDDRMRDRMPRGDEAWQAFEHCDEAFGGTLFISVTVSYPQPSGGQEISAEEISAEEISDVIDEVAAILDEEELLRSPMSIKTWLTAIPGVDHDNPPMSMIPLLPPEVQGLFWRPDKRQTLVVARVQDLGLTTYDPVLARVNARLTELSTRQSRYQLSLTGQPILQSRIVGHVIEGLFQSLLTTATIIFITLTLAFRSLRLGLIAIVPNSLPILAAASLRASFGATLDIASACAFIIALGIAVDDTIHLIWRYQQESKQSDSADDVVERTVLGVGVPLTMTTVVMVLGIATVITSELPTHRFFGWIACTTLTAAWLGDLILLPAMLTWLGGRKASGLETVESSGRFTAPEDR